MIAQPKEILIVDDEVGIRDLLSEILRDEGYQVSVAENAGQARDYRANAQPSVGALNLWLLQIREVTLVALIVVDVAAPVLREDSFGNHALQCAELQVQLDRVRGRQNK